MTISARRAASRSAGSWSMAGRSAYLSGSRAAGGFGLGEGRPSGRVGRAGVEALALLGVARVRGEEAAQARLGLGARRLLADLPGEGVVRAVEAGARTLGLGEPPGRLDAASRGALPGDRHSVAFAAATTPRSEVLPGAPSDERDAERAPPTGRRRRRPRRARRARSPGRVGAASSDVSSGADREGVGGDLQGSSGSVPVERLVAAHAADAYAFARSTSARRVARAGGVGARRTNPVYRAVVCPARSTETLFSTRLAGVGPVEIARCSRTRGPLRGARNFEMNGCFMASAPPSIRGCRRCSAPCRGSGPRAIDTPWGRRRCRRLVEVDVSWTSVPARESSPCGAFQVVEVHGVAVGVDVRER